MRHPSHWRLPAIAGALVLSASVFSASGFVAPAFAQTGPVGTTPASGTPELTTPGPLETIFVMKQCGDTMYVGGDFTSITQNGTNYTRDNLFSFQATAPYTITSWNPDVDGTVQTLAFDGGNCTNIYIGGTFKSVGGTAAENLAMLNSTTGAVVTSFPHDANNTVDTMAVTGSHLLTGGAFTEINGSSADPYYTSLNINTGLNDGYLDLHISGTYSYPGVVKNTTKVYDQQVSGDGGRAMVEGVFTSVGGQARQQIFQLWLNTKGNAEVTAWQAPIFNTHCITEHPFYAYEAAWAPGDNEVYVATTGYHIYNWNGDFPLPEPCDMALAFSADESSQTPTWANPTGCYSLFGVVADSFAVYVAGHPRYSENPDGCKKAGPGAIADDGLQGLNPANGDTLLNSSGQAMYSMSEANGFNMSLTSAGLWIASTNRYGSDECDGVKGHAGICFLPYPTS
jgi:hypothetical protein